MKRRDPHVQGIGMITKTERIRKGWIRVWIDEVPAFRLRQNDWDALRLSEGDLIDPEIMEDIEQRFLIPDAKKRCLDILMDADKSKEAVKEKLLGEGYPGKAADIAIAFAESFHYIDDLRVSMHYIECRRDEKSKPEIRMRLLAKGIPEDVIELAFEESEPIDHKAQILGQAARKHFSFQDADERGKIRFYQSLIRKGYTYGEIRDALEDM